MGSSLTARPDTGVKTGRRREKRSRARRKRMRVRKKRRRLKINSSRRSCRKRRRSWNIREKGKVMKTKRGPRGRTKRIKKQMIGEVHIEGMLKKEEEDGKE